MTASVALSLAGGALATSNASSAAGLQGLNAGSLSIPTKPGSPAVSVLNQSQNMSQAAPSAPREVLVRFRGSADAADRAEARAGVDGKLTDTWDLVPGLQMLTLPAGESVQSAVAELKDNPDVLYASPNLIMKLQVLPNDPQMVNGDLWNMNDIRAPQAWNTGSGSRDVPVAVIDSGVQMDHPDLKDNIWTNPGEIPDNGIDDDNNGYIDDVHGWDFVSSDNSPGYEGEPIGAHGTHVAGTIGAVGDNGIGVAGVNWRSSIMPLTVCSPSGSCYLNLAISALQYAVDKGVRVSNNSYGGAGCDYLPFRDAIAAAGTRGHLFVAAAGNNGSNNDTSPFCPASYNLSNVISVAASKPDGQLASFSNYGDSVDLAAPGQGIISTLPEGGFGKSGGYGSLNGTSMAAPHVAGAAALLLSLHPDWTVAQVKERLTESTHPLSVSSIWGRFPRGGGLDLANAVGGVTSDPLVVVTLDGTGTGVVKAASIGLACGDENGANDCARTATRGERITLHATAKNGAGFRGWAGACSGTQDCTITIDGPIRVRAVFGAAPSPGWGTDAIPVFSGRTQPLGSLAPPEWGLSFNGVSIARDGRTRAVTVVERRRSCSFGGSNNSGGVSVQRLTAGGWQTVHQIDPANEGMPEVECSGLGDTTTLSANGSTLLLTSQRTTRSHQCNAFVYENVDGGWTRTALLHPLGTTESGAAPYYACGGFGQGGSAISADGSRIVMSGSRWDDTAQRATAYFEVFDRGVSGWNRTERVELPDAPGCGSSSSPMRLSTSGDGRHILYGQGECSQPLQAGAWVGRVLAYDLEATGWQHNQTIEPDADETFDLLRFGQYTRISDDGSTAVLSSNGVRGAYAGFGAAIVLRRESGRWRRVARLQPPATGRNWMSGCQAITTHGERIVCTSSINSPGFSEQAGSMYVFDRGGGWGLRPERRDPAQLVVPEGVSDDWLSNSGALMWDNISMTGDGRTIASPIRPQSKLGDRYDDYRVGYTFSGPAPQAFTATPQVNGSEAPRIQRTSSFAMTFSVPDGAEGVTGFECSADSSPWSVCDSPHDFIGLNEGEHTLRVRASSNDIDPSTAVERTVTVDTTAPAAPGVGGKPALRTKQTSANFAFSGEAQASFECKLGSGDWGPCSSPKTYSSLGDGSHTFQTRQTDEAANTSDAQSYTWTVDTTAPAAPRITAEPAALTRQNSANFSFTGEAQASFECKLDTAAWSLCTSSKRYSSLRQGQHTFQVRQIDRAGNKSAAKTKTWRVDKRARAAASMLPPGITRWADHLNLPSVWLSLRRAQAPSDSSRSANAISPLQR